MKRQKAKAKDTKVSRGLQNNERAPKVEDFKEVENSTLEMKEPENKSKVKNNIFTLVKLQKVIEEQDGEELLVDPKTHGGK